MTCQANGIQICVFTPMMAWCLMHSGINELSLTSELQWAAQLRIIVCGMPSTNWHHFCKHTNKLSPCARQLYMPNVSNAIGLPQFQCQYKRCTYDYIHITVPHSTRFGSVYTCILAKARLAYALHSPGPPIYSGKFSWVLISWIAEVSS